MSDDTQFLDRAAKSRTKKVLDDIELTKKTIEREIDSAGGMYPHNGGRLSMAEACRRAGVHPITMMGPTHRDTTRPMLLTWIERLNTRTVTGARNVRKAVTQRADDWEAEYKLIAAKYKQMYSIEILQRDAKLEQLTSRVTELEAENLRLREQVSDGRIVRLPKNRS